MTVPAVPPSPAIPPHSPSALIRSFSSGNSSAISPSDAGAKSTFTYRADAAGGGGGGGGKKTKLSLNVEYEVPVKALGKMKASVFEKLNDAEGKRVVENLKALLED